MLARINENAVKNSYAAYSLGASRAERRGDYTEAEKLWNKAASSPCGALHRRWALDRAAFCNRAILKGWK
ncbi:ANR family transcriptional regulator [Escherichia coli]|nr:ANR family transcriptional regulator [Escherichia coli]